MEHEAAVAGVKLSPVAPLDPNAIIDPAVSPDGTDTDAPTAAPAAAPGPAAGARRLGGFDASEGTAKDPLKNKTFDLNSPHTVPDLK